MDKEQKLMCLLVYFGDTDKWGTIIFLILVINMNLVPKCLFDLNMLNLHSIH